MKSTIERLTVILNSPITLFATKTIFILIMLFVTRGAFATDILAGTDSDIHDTLAGTGRHYLIYYDAVAALLMFAGRKNVVVLGSVFVISLFINIILLMSR